MEKITQHRDNLRKEMIDFIVSAVKDIDRTSLSEKTTDELFDTCKVLKTIVKTPEKKEQFTIYTDGGYSQKMKTGAGAYVILQNERIIKKGGLKVIDTTNNVAELTAIECALKELPNGSEVVVRTDSQYAIGVLTGDFVARKNKELITEILNLIKQKKLSVSFLWVKGHSGNTYNEMCDKLCDEIAGCDLNAEYTSKKKSK